MKTTTCKTRWIGALLTLTLLAGLGAGTALAGEPTDLDGPYPDYPPLYPEDPEPDVPCPDYPPLYPVDPMDPVPTCVDGSLILMILPVLISVVVH